MNRNQQKGFSIIEIMIALIASLVVIGSILTLVVSSLRTNAQTISQTLLMQDMRSMLELVAREVRRAGYKADALDYIGESGFNNAYLATITLEDRDGDTFNDCVLFGYDADADANDAEGAEWRGFRRTVVDGRGVLEAKTGGGASADGCADGNWAALNDPDVIDVQTFRLDDSGSFQVTAGLPPDPDTGAEMEAAIEVRRIDIQLAARLSQDNTIQRQLSEQVRVRSDNMVAQEVAP